MSNDTLIGRENPYTCQSCGGITNTIHLDDGVTPFMLDCRAPRPDGSKCSGIAQSALYPSGPRPPHIPPPAWQWYKPTGGALLEPWEADHVANGGVLLRPRPLKIFVDDYPQWWAAYDKEDLKALVIEMSGEESWDPDYFDEVDESKTLDLEVNGAGELADEEDAKAGDATLVTLTFAEWAKKSGRGYLGGAE